MVYEKEKNYATISKAFPSYVEVLQRNYAISIKISKKYCKSCITKGLFIYLSMHILDKICAMHGTASLKPETMSPNSCVTQPYSTNHSDNLNHHKAPGFPGNLNNSGKLVLCMDCNLSNLTFFRSVVGFRLTPTHRDEVWMIGVCYISAHQ